MIPELRPDGTPAGDATTPDPSSPTSKSTGTTDCNRCYASCLCKLPSGHRGIIHFCPCGGAWSGHPNTGDFKVYQFPPPYYIGPVTP